MFIWTTVIKVTHKFKTIINHNKITKDILDVANNYYLMQKLLLRSCIKMTHFTSVYLHLS